MGKNNSLVECHPAVSPGLSSKHSSYRYPVASCTGALLLSGAAGEEPRFQRPFPGERRAGEGYREEKPKVRAEPWGRGCPSWNPALSLTTNFSESCSNRLSKSTQKCSGSEKNPPGGSQILSEISPLNTIPLRLSLSFRFQRCLGPRGVAVLTDWKNTKIAARLTTDFFFHLPCTSAFMGSGCSSLFLPYSVSISGEINARCLRSARPLPQAPLSPPLWAQNGPFLSHIRDKVKVQPELVAGGL